MNKLLGIARSFLVCVVFFEYNRIHADMAELADALVSGSSENTHAGSSPVIRTNHRKVLFDEGLFLNVLLHLDFIFEVNCLE
jgi:hypothetical protein